MAKNESAAGANGGASENVHAAKLNTPEDSTSANERKKSWRADAVSASIAPQPHTRNPRDRARQWARDAFLDVRAGKSWSFREKPSATQRTLVRGLEAELRELRNERAQLKSELARWRAKLDAAKLGAATQAPAVRS